MPYTTIPTVSDGQILSASYLNGLAANQSFLFGVGNQANPAFASYRSLHVTLDQTIMVWQVRHRVNWLHWRINSQGSNWNYARMYFNGVKVGQGPGGAKDYTGSYDLSSWAGLPNLKGPWASGIAYKDNTNGSGSGGNNDDGDVVSQSGSYYDCKLDHTSDATNQPGTGASWTTYWDLLTLPAVGSICAAWADVNFNSGQTVTVDYIIESDSNTF